MKCGLLLFETYHGKKEIGSSRIRGHWIAKYWDECEIYKQGQRYDALIFQKVYFPELARAFKGPKILDICDPDFMEYRYQVIEMIGEVDAVTVSSEKLFEVFKKFTNKPVYYIPDRLDLEYHKGKKYHQGQAKSVVWYGYSTGFDLLKPILMYLKKFNLSLIVIADKPFIPAKSVSENIEIVNYLWNIDTVNHDILTGDIIINPRTTKGKWKFKSNNKTLTAWSLGMPVAHNIEELEKFLDGEERQKESELRLKEVKEKWDVKYSIIEFQNIFKKIQEKK